MVCRPSGFVCSEVSVIGYIEVGEGTTFFVSLCMSESECTANYQLDCEEFIEASK